MEVKNLNGLKCQEIKKYDEVFTEQNVIVCDTETIQGKPYTIQFYDGIETKLEYVTESTIFDCYCDYISKRMKKNLSVWFFYCQFDIPIIHYPYREYFTYDGHKMNWGEFEFDYVTGKTWFGNHKCRNRQWLERDAFQYVFRGLEKVAKDLQLTVNKKPRPSFLGERKPLNATEQKEFEEYAIADVLVLWELVYWILSIHRQYNVGLSVSLADLCGKIFRKHFVKNHIKPTNDVITYAALSSYHGGKTESYVKGPVIVKNIIEYDITSAYPYAMSQIGNFFDYEMIRSKKVQSNGIYKISGNILCNYHPLYTHTFEREESLTETWVTGWELQSAFEHNCFEGKILDGYSMISHNGKSNGLAEYVWEFFTKKEQATKDKNVTERLWTKLALNSLYGKFISKIAEEKDSLEDWRGGVIFHPLIATLITGFVRSYVHTIEHACNSLHTSTDSFITRHTTLDILFPGVNGLGSVKKEHTGDALIIRPKVYLIFDKLDVNCYHKFHVSDSTDIHCTYCGAKVLKTATHGFYGSVQLLLNMWKGGQTNYVVNRMMRLKEAKRRKDPEVLPFVFSKQRRSLNVDWSQLTIMR